MNINWIAISALVSIYIGFAAILGAWIFQSIKKNNFRYQMIPLFAVSAIFVLSIWAIPSTSIFKVFLFIASLISLLITAFRLDQITFHKDWAWLYTSFSMGLVMIWSITQRQAVLAFSMSFLATLACLFALAKGKQAIIN
jgi:hypothetical protein